MIKIVELSVFLLSVFSLLPYMSIHILKSMFLILLLASSNNIFRPSKSNFLMNYSRMQSPNFGMDLFSVLLPMMFLSANYQDAKTIFTLSNLVSVFVSSFLLSIMCFNNKKLTFSQSIGLAFMISSFVLVAVTFSQFNRIGYLLTIHHPLQRPPSFLVTCFRVILVIITLSCLLLRLPKSFTLCEGLVISVTVVVAVENVVKVIFRWKTVAEDLHTWSLASALLMVLLFPLLPINETVICNSRKLFLSVQLLTGLLVTYSFVFYSLEKEPISWSLQFLLTKRFAVQLFTAWAVIFGTSAAFAIVLSSNHSNAIHTKTQRTRIRKLFHLAIVSVFTSGLLINARVLYFASSLCLAAFLVLEFVRAYKLTVFGKFLNSKLTVFIDEQDSGPIYLTPIYLLLSMCFPLWLHTGNINDRSLVLFSGVLSVGVGDTIASVYGSKYGRVKITGSNKSVDASFVAMLTVIIFTWVLVESNSVIMTINWVKYSFIVSMSMLLEFSTSQIDNSVLAPFFYSLLKIHSI